jgi:hypothetical protein
VVFDHAVAPGGTKALKGKGGKYIIGKYLEGVPFLVFLCNVNSYNTIMVVALRCRISEAKVPDMS